VTQAMEVDNPVASIIDLKAGLEALPSNSRLSDADTEVVYSLAYQMVAQARYETAFRYFSLLALYRPTTVKYLQGLALCYRMLERYDEALNVYSYLAVIDPTGAQHSLDIAECLMLKRDFEEAKQTVEMVIRYCKENKAPDKVRDRAEALSTLMKPKGATTA
jgi:type III secretion system low calcium response chaperone LcrH/SycD